MNESTNEVLNRLLFLHSRSLPIYLTYAAPYWHGGDEVSKETLEAIAANQRYMADRVGEMIVEHNGVTEFGEFPMVFTGYHDLGFGFLLNQLIARQKREIAAIEWCVEQLRLAPLAKALAEEALGAAKGHLESLEELRSGTAAHA